MIRIAASRSCCVLLQGVQNPACDSATIRKRMSIGGVGSCTRALSSEVVVTMGETATTATTLSSDSSSDTQPQLSSPFLSHITVNDKHVMMADEPTNVGGGDLGPSPYDYLLGALGSCTVMTLRMYADKKQLPLQGVSVTLRHAKIHVKDCQECQQEDDDDAASTKKRKSPLFDRIERQITVHGDSLTPQDKEKLLQIANKCPVHRTLEQGQVVVVSSLAE